jgi:hypothetical protein
MPAAAMPPPDRRNTAGKPKRPLLGQGGRGHRWVAAADNHGIVSHGDANVGLQDGGTAY